MDKPEEETESQRSLDSNAENVPPPRIPPRNKKRAPDPPSTSSPAPPLPPKESRSKRTPPVRPPPPIPLMEETTFKPNPHRQVLVAASKSGTRDRKPETRQRQPASIVKQPESPPVKDVEDELSVRNDSLQKAKLEVIQHVLRQANSQTTTVRPGPAVNPTLYQPNPTYARLVLARNAKISQFSPSSVTYPRWVERSGTGDPEINSRLVRRVFGGSSGIKQWKMAGGRAPQLHHGGQRLTQAAKLPSAVQMVVSKSKPAVTRSGSLTSQGSSSSDSGNEGQQPKSALKKVRRNRGSEPKKSVTFNALATVQVMQE